MKIADIKDILEQLALPGESYVLQKKVASPANEDGFGNLNEDWSEVADLTGIIQKNSEDPDTKRGREEIAEYRGFFHTDFNIPVDELPEYRIKHVIVVEDANFTRYFKIETIDRNIVLDNAPVYYELTLELYKRYEGGV